MPSHANSTPPEKHDSIDRLESSWLPYSFRSIAIVIALFAVLIRLAPVMRSNLDTALIHDDSFWYIQTADGLRHGCGFARLIDGACARAEIMRTPGYPLFLTMMPSIRWALAAQAVVGGIVAILVALWIVRSWSVGAALLTEFLVAFDLPSEVLSNQVMAEELFQLLLLLVVVPPLLVISRATKDSRGLTDDRSSQRVSGGSSDSYPPDRHRRTNTDADSVFVRKKYREAAIYYSRYSLCSFGDRTLRMDTPKL